MMQQEQQSSNHVGTLIDSDMLISKMIFQPFGNSCADSRLIDFSTLKLESYQHSYPKNLIISLQLFCNNSEQSTDSNQIILSLVDSTMISSFR